MRTNPLFGFVIATVLFASCGKDSSAPVVNNPQPDKDSTKLTISGSALLLIERTDNEMEWVATELLMNWDEYANGKTFFGAATATGRTTEEGEEILLTFNSAVTCTDGKKRSGKVLVELSNTYRDILISPDEYKVNDTAIKGSYSFERFRNAENRLQMNLAVSNGEIVGVVKFIGGRSRVKMAGEDTPYFEEDDVFEYATGNCYFTIDSRGILGSATVISTVTEKYCFKAKRGFLPVAGRIEYENSNYKTNVLNFGNDTGTGRAYMEKEE